MRRLALPERALGPVAGSLTPVAGMGRRGSRERVRLGADRGRGGCRSPAHWVWSPRRSRRQASRSSASAPPLTPSPARSWRSTSSRIDRCAARRDQSQAGPCCSQEDPGRLAIVPPRRGVVSTVTVRVATAAPLGLLWWSRTVCSSSPVPSMSPRNLASRLHELRRDDRGRRRSGAAASPPSPGTCGASALTSTVTGGAGCTGTRAPTPVT